MLTSLLSSATPTIAAPPLNDRVDWASFLGRADLVWDSLPEQWHEGAFLGNGLLGAMIYHDKNSPLRWDIGRSDVTAHWPHGNFRLPIGEMILQPVGKVLDGTVRLTLWNAEATGRLKTDKGSIRWRSFVPADQKALVVELQPDAGEAGLTWQWRPEAAVNPRSTARPAQAAVDKTPDPRGHLEKRGDVSVWVQPRSEGGEFATAWQNVVAPDGHRLLFLSVGDSFPKAGGAQEAVDSVNRARETGLPALVASHRAWWHAYFPESFLSIPDTRMESFYWIQMYKLGSATRADRPAIDLMGPWFRNTPWPMFWWNLNIELTYWPVYASNRLELGESLCRMLDAGRENLISNVPEEYQADSAGVGRTTSYDCKGKVSRELCNLPWTCHNYWLQYRYSMDDTMLRDRLFPLLRRSINFYLHLLKKGDDGKLHLPKATSPEFPVEGPDTNIDLSLLRWGCQTLLASCERLKIADPLIPRWKEVLADLTPYPVGPDGLMIARGVPLDRSHRHFSHLLMIYPLRLMTWDQPENRELIAQSLDHWIGFNGALRGYSYTGAASICASIGRPDQAVGLLNTFLDKFVKPNTMYLEAGPVIETPLAGANTIQELLLQSWGGRMHIFPGVPASWKDAAFHHLRADGAFLVSAVRQNGQTRWVQIESLAGEPCRVQTDFTGPVHALGSRPIGVTPLAGGEVEFDMKKGESAVLYTGDRVPTMEMSPVAAQPDRLNFYGSPKVAPSVQAADGGFTLRAAEATLHGPSIFYEVGGGKDDLGHWISLDDRASWLLAVDRPGRFTVKATYGAGTGGRFEVECAGSRIGAATEKTGGMIHFKEFQLGTITIPKAGRYTLSVKPIEFHGALMNLKMLTLTPMH